ncbi:unnamed protein product [Victoria cruziana]
MEGGKRQCRWRVAVAWLPFWATKGREELDASTCPHFIHVAAAATQFPASRRAPAARAPAAVGGPSAQGSCVGSLIGSCFASRGCRHRPF